MATALMCDDLQESIKSRALVRLANGFAQGRGLPLRSQ